MRKVLILALMAATAVTPVAASAQEQYRRGGGNRAERVQQRSENRQQRQEERAQTQQVRQAVRQQQRPAAPQRSQAPAAAQQQAQRAPRVGGADRSRGNSGYSAYPQAWQGNRNDPRQEAARQRYQRLERQNQQQFSGQRRDWRQGRREDRRDFRQDRREDRRDWREDRRDDRRWDRNWRNNNRYNWQGWRYQNRNLFRLRPYYSPYRNYSYNRLIIGGLLDQLFWGRNYWISDPWQYRLPPAEPGYQWVRYYNDVVLVDTYSGEVVDVIYDFFY